MIWDKILKQEFALKVLKTHITTKRLASAYLLTGEEGSGKEDLALAFASSLNCLDGRLFESCFCSSCAKIAGHNHPDVRFIGKARTEARSIKIEEVREMISWGCMKPYEGRWKVFVIDGAERLTTDASNALLKTLEEPAPGTVFCLLVENKSYLLETIQSRSFELKLRPAKDSVEPDDSTLKHKIKGLGVSPWEDVLESLHTPDRIKLNRSLVDLMNYFRGKIANSELHSHQNVGPYVEALEKVYETCEAVDANANAKICLTRLAVHLRRLGVPS